MSLAPPTGPLGGFSGHPLQRTWSNRMSQTYLRTITATTLLVLLGMASLTDAGNTTTVTTPFKIKGGGIAPEGLRPPGETTTHLIEGTATHLGRHTGVGNLDIHSLAPVSATTLAGTFSSHDPCVFEAANGDELVCHYGRTDKGATAIGTFEITILDFTPEGPLVEALFIAEFVPQPESTGRFAGASGSWIMYAQTEPFILGSDDPVAYSWEGEGTLARLE